MEKNLLLILNPFAGQKRANKFLPEIIRIFWDHGYRCVTYVTAARGDATKYAFEHAGEFERVVCIGGDGTLNETIAGVLTSGADVPIGYIPAGTTNDFASSLGLSTDILQAAKDAAAGEVHHLDVGSFNGRYFTYTASCGAFTKASYNTPQSMKNTLGHLAYILEGIKEISSIRKCHMRVTTEKGVLEDDFLFCSITNSTSVGGILKLNSGMVALNDGKFEVMLVRNPTVPLQLSTILHGLTTLEIPNEMIHFFSAERICVELDEAMEWTLDGERAEAGERIELLNHHNAVKMVLPIPMAAETQENEL